jgi:FMN-dependent NADH-azoreductase
MNKLLEELAMSKLLHICATPRGAKSRTLKITNTFLEIFKKRHPECEIDTIDLFSEKLPDINLDVTDGKYLLMEGGEISDKLKPAWQEIENHITHFLSADIYLISCPMWNFSIPYRLKHYIDVIAQPKYLFRYTEHGVEGLVKNKKMFIIASRGGNYSPDSPFRFFDHQEPYLRTVFGFVGITDITFIVAQPTDALGTEVMQERVTAAQGEAKRLAESL